MLCHCLFLASLSSGQSLRQFNMEKDDISTMIPPLQTLIDSAIAHNPGLKSSEAQINAGRYSLLSARRLWTKNLSLSADLRYGNFTNYSNDAFTDIAVATNKSEFRYGAGGTVKFVIYDFVDRKNQLRIAQAGINDVTSLGEEKKSELRKMVITYYNDLILKQRLLKLSAKNIETIRITMQMVEKEFLNGVIPLTEYARMSGIVSDSEAAFESARMDFMTAYMLLEEVVCMKFNIVSNLP